MILILVRAGNSGQVVNSSWQGLQQSLPFIERTQEAARRYRESAPPEGEKPLSKVSTITFEHVYFSYRPGTPMLRDISFEVAHDEAIGIIGPSGAGKSTLVQLLLQLRPPESGRYLVNGEDVASSRATDWHRLVSYVPQEPRLLHAERRGQHPLLPRHRRRGSRTGGEAGAHPRRHHRLAEGLRHDRRPARRRRLRRPAAAHLPRAGARGASRGARARRAHERAGPALGDADPGVADGAEAAS